MHSRSSEVHDEDSARQQFVGRVGSGIAMVVLAVLALGELMEFRGEMAFTRLSYVSRLVEKSRRPTDVVRAAQEGVTEMELMAGSCRGDAFALRETTRLCLRWALRDELAPVFRFRMAEAGAEFAGLAVLAAPSEYLGWLWLSRALVANSLEEQAQTCFKRARELAPRGMKLDLMEGVERREL